MKSAFGTTALRCICVLALLMLVAPVALAADVTPPVITHERVTTGLEGRSIAIRATIADDAEVSAAYVYFKPVGTDTFLFVTMAKGTGSYVGQIPAKYVNVGTMEYYLTAVDTSSNVSTLKDDSGNPFRIDVASVAHIEPQATLIYPAGVVTQPTGVVISIRLNEAFALADQGLFTVTFDGTDVTDACNITRSSVTYAVPGSLSTGKYDVRISVADVNGMPFAAQFTVVADIEKPVIAAKPISGSISAHYAYDLQKNTASAYARINASGELGPFSAQASIRTDDPVFTGVPGQTKSHVRIGYRSRLLDLDLIDTSLTLSNLIAYRYPIRGVAGTLKLGPFSFLSAYGVSRQAVPSQSYQRSLLAARSAFNLFGVLQTGFNIVQVSDQVVDAAGVPALIAGVSGEQTYTASLDVKVSILGASLTVEAASNVSFDGVQDRMDWRQVLTDAGVPNANQFAEILEVLLPIPDYYLLKQTIDALKAGNPIPPGFSLGNIVFPVMDTALRAGLEIPIAGGKLTADYFWVGQRFHPLAAPTTAGHRGYEVKLSDLSIGGIAKLSVAAGQKVDKVESPLINPAIAAGLIGDLGIGSGPVADAIANLVLSNIGSDAGSDQAVYNTLGVSVSATPQGMPTLSFDYGLTKKSDYVTGAPEFDEARYAVGVEGIGYTVAGTRATLGLGLSYAVGTDVALHTDSERGMAFTVKTTLPLQAVKASVKASIGSTVSLKNEADPSDDVTLGTKALEVKLSRAFGKLSLSTTAKYAARDNGLPGGAGAVGTTILSLVVAGQYSLGKAGTIQVQVRAVDYRDRVDPTKDKQSTIVSASYRLVF
jgi:hypothetical protein